MRPGRYYLNKKENVPKLSPEDEGLLMGILLGFLVVALGIIILITQ